MALCCPNFREGFVLTKERAFRPERGNQANITRWHKVSQNVPPPYVITLHLQLHHNGSRVHLKSHYDFYTTSKITLNLWFSIDNVEYLVKSYGIEIPMCYSILSFCPNTECRLQSTLWKIRHNIDMANNEYFTSSCTQSSTHFTR